MNLDVFNNLLNSTKENNIVQNFIKELSNHLKKGDNQLSNENSIKENNLKEENCLYQVVEMDTDGAYLQNTNNNRVSKETDIPQELLDKIGNDSVLRYKDGKYIYEEELTQKFLDNLVDIKEYRKIQENFAKESNIQELAQTTSYKIESRSDKYSLLNYTDKEKHTIKVPNELIPFWAKEGDSLYYKNGKFNRLFH